MSPKNFFARIFGKQSPSQTLIALQKVGQPVSTPHNYAGFSKEAFQKNVVAYQAITGIARNAASVPWCLYRKDMGRDRVEIEDHPILTLLKRPNPLQGQSAFFERFVAFFMIAGNAYIEAVGPTPTAPPTELWVPRPDRMKIVPGGFGLPQAYEYSLGTSKKVYPVDIIKGKSPILHLKTFNPTDDWYGMSPIEAACLAVDNHNEAGVYNLALLQNRATPSGALIVTTSEGNPSGTIDDEQYNRLEQRLSEKFMGSGNAGRPMILEGGLDWKEMGFSPRDMDWIQGKHTSARDIAHALGYPSLLLGLPGDSTYNNLSEARLALYTDTVLPILDLIKTELNNWLTPAFGQGLYLDYDRDNIDAIAPLREAVWNRMQNASWLTPNEKRAATGYEPVDGGDELYIQSSMLPLNMANDSGQTDPNAVDPSDYQDENTENETEVPDPEADAAEAAGKSMERKASEVRFDDYVKRWVDSYVGDRITGIEGTTKKRVTEAVRDAYNEHLDEGTNLEEFRVKIQSNVGDTYDEMGDGRARTIARTETTIASGEGSRAAAEALGIEGMVKEWVSADDDRTRGNDPKDESNHVVMNGVRVGMKEQFSVPSADGDDQMDGPGDSSAPGDQVINCRCVLIFDTDDAEKSINLRSPAAKRRHVTSVNRKRESLQRAFAVQVKSIFAKEKEHMQRSLANVSDLRMAEITVLHAVADSRKDWEQVLKANLTAIAKEFGRDVLKAIP